MTTQREHGSDRSRCAEERENSAFQNFMVNIGGGQRAPLPSSSIRAPNEAMSYVGGSYCRCSAAWKKRRSLFNLQPEKVIYVWMLLHILTPSAGLKGKCECLSARFGHLKCSFRS